MELLLVRHARAEEREAFARSGQPDALRPLTDDGRKRMKVAVRGLRRVLPGLAAIATSPLLRARQTAEYLGEAYGLPLQEVAALAPDGGGDALYRWLARQSDGPIALVGHEPDLGALASHLLAGVDESFVPLKKGACCLIDCHGRPGGGCAELRWLLTSAQLRRMGGEG